MAVGRLAGRPSSSPDTLNYPNGIGVTPHGTVIIVEHGGLMRIADRSWYIEKLPSGGDGFAFDVEGNLYTHPPFSPRG